MTEDEKSVQAACEAFGQAMREMDFGAMAPLWDREYEHLVYQPEEHEKACRSWDEITAYLDYIPGAVANIREWRQLETDIAVIGDAALVYTLVHACFELKGVDEPLDGDVRFTFGLRRTEDGWRFVHCHESRQLIVDEGAA